MPSSQKDPGLYIENTSIYDIQSIYSLDINSKQFKEFLVLLTQSINKHAMAINNKDTGFYPLTEFINGQLYFPDPAGSSTSAQTPTQRNVFRKVFNCGALLNNANLAIPQNIDLTSTFKFTRIYGVASDPVALSYIPLPYAGPTPGYIGLSVDNLNINIRTTDNKTAYTNTFVVLEYIKY